MFGFLRKRPARPAEPTPPPPNPVADEEAPPARSLNVQPDNPADLFGASRAPDFLCIGTEKAGTTWLWRQFREHPDIGVPAIKELRHFGRSPPHSDFRHFRALKELLTDQAAVPPTRQFLERVATEIRIFYGSDDDYYTRILGQLPQPVVGEVTPQYCLLREKGIAQIRAVAPHARIVFLLRDPVDRTLSGAKMRARAAGLEMTDEAVLEHAMHPVQLNLSRYSRSLPRFEQAFEGRVLVGFFDDVAAHPERLLGQICAFLDVPFDPARFPDLAEKVNKGSGYRPGREAEQTVYAELTEEYDFLETRFPERAAAWRARYR